MAGFCSFGSFGPHFQADYTEYTKSAKELAREAELNSGRQEKLPFAQLVLKPTIADNAYPGKLSEPGNNSYYDMKYGVHVPAGGKIKVEADHAFPDWYRVIVYSKDGLVHSIKNMPESEITRIAKKYTDTDPGTPPIKSMKFYTAEKAII